MMNDDLKFGDFNDRWIKMLTTEYLEDAKKHKMTINTLFNNNEGIITDAIQFKSYCIPILNTITIENIKNFGEYFHERFSHVNDVIKNNTKLVNLYKNEISFNWVKNIYNNLNLFINICDDEGQKIVKNVINRMGGIQNQVPNFLNKTTVNNPGITVSYGGGNESDNENDDLANYVMLFIKFVMYHFPILAENNKLVSIFDLPSSESEEQTGGDGEYEITALKNYSGVEKSAERLIFLISVKINDKTTKYFIKITINLDHYRKEITNYHYLNDYVDKLKSKKKYAPQIMKFFSPWKNNETSSYVLKQNNMISLILNEMQYNMTIPLNIINGVNKFREEAQKNSYSEIFYMITEVDEMYTPIVKTQKMNQVNKLRAFIRVAKDLQMLNKNLGFVHWDLHKENILFKLSSNNDLCPKFFDFDLSDLCLVQDENNMIELNNQYFISTNNYKMCTSNNMLNITDANILTTDTNIQYRIKAGYLFDLIRIHTNLVYDINEHHLDIFSDNVKQFIVGWTDEIKTKNAIPNYFNAASDYVIKWTNKNSYSECINDFMDGYDTCFEFESCEIILLCAYNLMFSQKYNHANKKLFFKEISYQVERVNLNPENRKYMTDELMVLSDILKNKQYTEIYLNKLSVIQSSISNKCNVSPSFIEYQTYIYNNVKKQVEENTKVREMEMQSKVSHTVYKNMKKDYLAIALH